MSSSSVNGALIAHQLRYISPRCEVKHHWMRAKSECQLYVNYLFNDSLIFVWAFGSVYGTTLRTLMGFGLHNPRRKLRCKVFFRERVPP